MGKANQVKLAIVQVLVVITFALIFVGCTSNIDNIEILSVALSIEANEGLKFFLVSWR